MEKMREAHNSPPTQLSIILSDAYSTDALHQEAQRHSNELQQGE